MKCPGCGGEMEPIEVVSIRFIYGEDEDEPEVDDEWVPAMYCPECEEE